MARMGAPQGRSGGGQHASRLGGGREHGEDGCTRKRHEAVIGTAANRYTAAATAPRNVGNKARVAGQGRGRGREGGGGVSCPNDRHMPVATILMRRAFDEP